MDRFSPNQVPTYLVEHLATFSTTSPQHEHITPRMALQRLFKMEKTSGKNILFYFNSFHSSILYQSFPQKTVCLLSPPPPFYYPLLSLDHLQFLPSFLFLLLLLPAHHCTDH